MLSSRLNIYQILSTFIDKVKSKASKFNMVCGGLMVMYAVSRYGLLTHLTSSWLYRDQIRCSQDYVARWPLKQNPPHVLESPCIILSKCSPLKLLLMFGCHTVSFCLTETHALILVSQCHDLIFNCKVTTAILYHSVARPEKLWPEFYS